MSLRLRIALVVASVVAVVVVAVGFSLLRSTEAALIDEIDGDLLQRVTARGRGDGPQVRLPFDRFGELERGELSRAGNRGDPFGAVVGFDALARVIDSDGNVLGVLAGGFDASTDADLLDEARSAPVLHDGSADGGRIRVVTAALGRDVFVQLARPLDEVDAVLSTLRWRTGLIGGLAIAAAAVTGWFIASATARPIRRLTVAAEYVAETGDLSRPVEGSGNDEVGRLARSFTTMLDALAASRRQQHQLVMDASHELRTPLTSLRTNVDVLGRGHDLTDAERAALVDDLDVELSELSDLVTELVDLATDVRADEDLAPLTLAEVAGPVVERARRRSERSIEIDERRSMVLEGRPEALARAVKNLVDNAAKFSPAGSPIRVEIDGGVLTVHDQGPGIPVSEWSSVFERFHRVESSRTLPGSGLGLAIVRQVVEAHDGTVFAAASPDGGAAVGFRLPTVD